MKKALIDSSSAIIIFKSGLFDKLVHLYEIFMSESVYDELTNPGYAGADEFINYRSKKKISVVLNKSSDFAIKFDDDELFRLDRGERDTLFEFFNGTADFIIIDDGKGAEYCRDNKIPYISALLVPRILQVSNIISEDLCRNKTEMIIFIGRYSKKIIESAQNFSLNRLKMFYQ